MNMPLQYRVQNTSAQRLGDGYSVTCLDRKGIFSLGSAWEELSRNTIEENPYYSPTYMRALLENTEINTDIMALAVYREGKLAGFCPFITDKWRWLGAASVNRAWKNPYITLTTPLVERHNPRQTVQALLMAMAGHATAGRFWLFEELNLDGPAGVLIDEVVRKRNLSSCVFDEFDRPTLEQGSTFDQHMLDHVSKKRRRDLKRNRKRLSEKGRVEMRFFTSGPQLEAAVEDFLRIEASGWKGERGTALACNQNLLAFARQAFGTSCGKTITRADVLYLDEQPIAVSLAIYVGKTAFTLKCTYDESYRTYSPGLLLEQDIIEDFLKNHWVERLDSATAAGGHVVQGLWNGSIRVGDLLLCADDSKSPEYFKNYAQIEKLRRLCRQKLKCLVARSRGQ